MRWVAVGCVAHLLIVEQVHIEHDRAPQHPGPSHLGDDRVLGLLRCDSPRGLEILNLLVAVARSGKLQVEPTAPGKGGWWLVDGVCGWWVWVVGGGWWLVRCSGGCTQARQLIVMCTLAISNGVARVQP